VLTRIDHIGIAVEELDAAIALYEQRLVMPVVHREIAEEIGLELVLLDIGESHVELLAPVRAQSMLAGFLAEHGPGLHHVAYATDDIEAELARLTGEGMRLIDTQPRTGIRGSRIAFLEPDGTGHVLTELVQPSAGYFLAGSK
jgi:methylmalonyl-CoA/ethylmalonyl-CoA epimerase